MKIIQISPDIKKLDIDYIVSFNYTHTFLALYNLSVRIKKQRVNSIDFIHGEANIFNSIETNNMVLGIDEYLSEDRKNKDIEFIAFKKYYQRVCKGIGYEYKILLNQIQNRFHEYLKMRDYYMEMYRRACQIGDYIDASKWRKEIDRIVEKNNNNNLYIFGHSLDITDRDILRDLIMNDNVYTTIYYHKAYDDNGKDDNGRNDLGTKIANLVKVIGQDELIRRTGGSTKTIEFKLQQDMVEQE